MCTLLQLKLKYKREEKLHKDIVDAALRSSTTFDYDFFKRLADEAAAKAMNGQEAEEPDLEPAADQLDNS